MRISLSSRARRDLDDIVRHISRNSPRAAERFGHRLLDRAMELADPGVRRAGRPMPRHPGVFKLIEGQYLILYFMPRPDCVRILRFWHGARDGRSLRLGS